MATLVEICGSKTVEPKNTGAKGQCLEGATVKYALTKNNTKFVDVADFKKKTSWDALKQSKDVVIFFSIEANLENSNTEASYYEGRTLKQQTKAPRKGKKFTHHLGLCSHSALASYMGSGYNRVIEFTEDGNIKAVFTDNGEIQGQLLSNFNVGIRKDATLDTPASTDVEFIYANYKDFEDDGVIVTPDFDILNYEGVYPVALEVVGTPTATGIVVKAFLGCGNEPFESFDLVNFQLEKVDGTPQTIVGVTKVGNKYTISGTALESGVLSTDVYQDATITAEAEKLKITI